MAGWLPLVKSNVTVPFALDGSGFFTATASSISVPLTTVNGSGLIVAAILTNAASVTSVTGTGLTFTQRSGGSVTTGGGSFLTIYTSPYSSNFNSNVIITPASSSFTTVTAFGISGLAASPFDSGGPVTSASTNTSITTANANDFVFFNSSAAGASPTVGGGWTQLSGASGFQLVGYQLVSVTGTYTSSFSSSSCTGTVIDAVKKGP